MGLERLTDSGATRSSSAFPALRHRNFRLFLCGQLVSLSGSSMQQVALAWLVYRLNQSPFLLGLVVFFGQFPSLLVTPFAGVWADRFSRHRLVIATQITGMLQVLRPTSSTVGRRCWASSSAPWGWAG